MKDIANQNSIIKRSVVSSFTRRDGKRITGDDVSGVLTSSNSQFIWPSQVYEDVVRDS